MELPLGWWPEAARGWQAAIEADRVGRVVASGDRLSPEDARQPAATVRERGADEPNRCQHLGLGVAANR